MKWFFVGTLGACAISLIACGIVMGIENDLQITNNLPLACLSITLGVLGTGFVVWLIKRKEGWQ